MYGYCGKTTLIKTNYYVRYNFLFTIIIINYRSTRREEEEVQTRNNFNDFGDSRILL